MQRMRLTLRLFLATAFILAVSACTAVVPPASTQENSKVTNSANVPANLPRLKGKATVELKTNKGPIVLEVDGDNAPVTAGNFVDLVKRKFFDNLTFHRVVPGFVVQGGDPRGNGTGGFIDPATKSERTIPFEIRPTSKDGKPAELLYGSTYSENGLSARLQPPVLAHSRGALAMARSQDPNSASSQFYITLADTHQLDGEYAVFGKVLKGQQVVDQIRVGDKILSATVVSGG